MVEACIVKFLAAAVPSFCFFGAHLKLLLAAYCGDPTAACRCFGTWSYLYSFESGVG